MKESHHFHPLLYDIPSVCSHLRESTCMAGTVKRVRGGFSALQKALDLGWDLSSF